MSVSEQPEATAADFGLRELPGTEGAQLTKCPTSLGPLLVVEKVDEEDTVEVVDLVLEHAAGEIIEFEVEFIALEVVSLHVDLGGTDDVPVQAGYRQTTLGELGLATGFDDDGVDDDTRIVVAASPTPGASYIVTNMSCTSLANAPSTRVTSAARWVSTGSPMTRIAWGAIPQG
jgi:hypothetical protein